MTITNSTIHSIRAGFGRRIFLPSLAIFASLLALPAFAGESRITGRAAVIDGDTIIIASQHIRLYAIDAPEKSQLCATGDGAQTACGQEAAAYLREIIGRKHVSCAPVTPADQYGRIVARCAVKGQDLGRSMVQAGHALAYRRYGRDYIEDENQAREQMRGLWAGQFEAPWTWRHKHQD
jgi:endonuclease YncB( thermonuclease family)